MIRGVIFDVDGTILDSMPIWNRAGDLYLAQYGIQPQEEISEKLFEMTLQDGSVYMKEQYHLKDEPAKILDDILSIVKEGYAHTISAKPGMIKLIRDLKNKGIPLTVVSSGVKEYIELAFERLGISDCFEEIFSSSSSGHGKDESTMFLEAVKTMGCKKEETAVIDDGLYALRTVKKEGFITVGVYDHSSEALQNQLREEVHLYIYKTEELTTERLLML